MNRSPFFSTNSPDSSAYLITATVFLSDSVGRVKLDEGHDLDGAAEVRATVLTDVSEVNVTAVDIGGGNELPADATLRLVALVPSEAVFSWWWWRQLGHSVAAASAGLEGALVEIHGIREANIAAKVYKVLNRAEFFVRSGVGL